VPFAEATRAVGLIALVLLGMVGWLSARAATLPAQAPDRLVAELRLAQLAAMVLAFLAGAYVGMAVAHPTLRGTGLDVALALGFLVIAVTAPLRDPREALTILALAFLGHAVVDVLHRPGILPVELAPAWYIIGCALVNALIAALCYLPLLRR
jgi:hypothetical protein